MSGQQVIPIARKLSSKLCLMAPDEIQLLIMTHLTYNSQERTLQMDQGQLALSLTDHTVMDVRRRCPDIMLIKLTVSDGEHLITIHMPRLTCPDSKDIYFTQKVLCEIMQDSYQTWNTVVSPSK